MEKFTESLAMGSYGVYVWSSFFIAAAVIIAMTLLTMRAARKAQSILNSLKDSKD